MSADVVWRLDGDAAALKCGPLTGRLQLNDLRLGWLDLAWRGRSCAAFEVLRTIVAPDTRVVESYVRYADLVVNYTQSAACAVAPQFYWRARYITETDAVAIETIVSLQTNLLESLPSSMIRSLAKNARLFHAPRLDAGAFTLRSENHLLSAVESQTHLVVLRHESLGISYAEMVHPSDFESLLLKFQADDHSGTFSILFQKPHLEKGVIRRARICGWFLPAENDLAVAVELAKQFIDEPLPLTT